MTQQHETNSNEPEIGPSGGNLSRVVLVTVVSVILIALAIMLYGAATEGVQRADPTSTSLSE